MTRGWFTAVRSWRGRVGTRIPEFGMRVRTFPLESGSESVSTGAMDGAGIIGDRTGIIIGLLMTTIATTPEAARFTTETITTEGAMPAVGSPAIAAEIVAAPMKGTGLPARMPAAAGPLRAVPAQPPGLLRETTRLLEGTLNHVVRAARARAPSAATTMAERPGVIPLVGVPVSVAEEHVAAVDRAAGAAIGNPSVVMLLVVCRNLERETSAMRRTKLNFDK